MTKLQFFHPYLFKKVIEFEWALLSICLLGEAIALRFAKPDLTAPNIGVSLIFLAVFGLLSMLAPVRAPYWDRLCFLLLELVLVTGGCAAGLARFCFPLFMIVIAKACLLLDRRGLFIVFAGAVALQTISAGYKLFLQNQDLMAHGVTLKAIGYLAAQTIVYNYVATALMVLVVMLTLSLQSEQKSRLETERLSREVESLATELERTRIAREIHDSLGHTLTSLNIQLDVARKLQQRDPERSNDALQLAKELASQSLTDVRMAVQSIRNTADFNFRDAIEALVAEMKQTKESLDVNLVLNVEQMPPSISYQLFRVIQESLTNVLKHADASVVTIELDQKEEKLQLRVTDNGCGLALSNINSGFGIRGMQERVESLHGTVAISAEADQGTTIEIMVPMRPAELSGV